MPNRGERRELRPEEPLRSRRPASPEMRRLAPPGRPAPSPGNPRSLPGTPMAARQAPALAQPSDIYTEDNFFADTPAGATEATPDRLGRSGKPSINFVDDSQYSWEKNEGIDTERQAPTAFTASSPLSPRLESAATEVTFSEETDEEDLLIDDMLEVLLDMGGSDLHISAKQHPNTRINGDMTPLTQFRKLSPEDIERLAASIMSADRRVTFEDNWELDFRYDLEGKCGFRVNAHYQQGSVGLVMRAIPWKIPTVEELDLPQALKSWAGLPRGLVLITGPTGSGKSTTLAAIIDWANKTRRSHIMTIEDPIEFVHQSQMSIINQREVGTDTKSFGAALKHVLRQDPDIILVGELRDYETISVALSAAETGHLVFGTLHTQSAQETISRIIDVFPENSQAQVRTQLAATIQGIACQSLLKTYDGKGRIAAVEILMRLDSIAANIRQGKLEQIPTYMTPDKGMNTLDQHLEQLIRDGKVHWEEALSKANNRTQLIGKFGGEEELMKLDRRIQHDKNGGM